MKAVTMAISKLLYVLIICTIISNIDFCHGRQVVQKPSPAAVVVQGTVFCDTCAHGRLSDNTYFISGASVAVKCGVNRKSGSSIMVVEGESDAKGEFRIEVPINPSKLTFHVRKCWVELMRRAEGSWCNVPSISTSPKLTLTSPFNAVRLSTYSAGYLSYRPEIVPTPCLMDDSLSNVDGRGRGREALEADETNSKATVPPPFLPTIPPLPIFPPFPPFNIPNAPPLPVPKFSVPPLPAIIIPSVPNFSFPPLPTTPFPFNFPPIPFFTPPPPATAPPPST